MFRVFRISMQTVVTAMMLSLSGCGGNGGSPDTRPKDNGSTPVVQAGGSNKSVPQENVSAPDAAIPTVPGLSDRISTATLADVVEKVDAAKDKVWREEAVNERLDKKLKQLGKLLAHRSRRTAKAFSVLAADEFQSGPLRPATAEVYRDRSLIVFRSTGGKSAGAEKDDRYVGAGGLRKAIARLATPLGDSEESHIRFKFKTMRVALEPGSIRTMSNFQASGQTPAGIVQINATWHCRWAKGPDEVVKLASIEVRDYEEIRPNGTHGPLFADCTEALLGHLPAYRQQLVYGADHWFARLDVAFSIHQGDQGIALGDVNGDGLEDLLVCQPSGLPNRLFVRQKDGSLRDETKRSGLDWLDISRCGLFLDLDHDGDQDLVMALAGKVVLLENDATGHFTHTVTVDMPSRISSVVAADYDLDGDLDVYVCGYSPSEMMSAGDVFANPVPFHDANNGAKNYLMRNDGDFNFADVTISAGLDANNRRFSFAAQWEDFDNDGDQDLYVANDFGRNNLYRNDDGKFTDIAASAGVEDHGSGMSTSWGDFDGDGLIDLYVGNMFSSAGNRVTHQKRFGPGKSPDELKNIRRLARGNALFKNMGDGTFRDVTDDANVWLGRWAWGSMFVDLNNDGRQDIYVANGFFTTPDPGDL